MKTFPLLALAFLACSSGGVPVPQGDGGTQPPSGWRAAVGAGGTMLQTFDEQSWSLRSPLPTNLFGVTCVGNLKGWAVGDAGTIVHTEDGGQTWSAQTSHLAATLRGIHFADALHGVVAGDSGALARTIDGGQTWTPIANGSANLTAVAATQSGKFFVSGSGGAALRSIDFGATFQTVNVVGAGDLATIASDIDGALVLAGDTSGHLLASTDGAQSFHVEAAMAQGVASISMAGVWGGSSWAGVVAIAAGNGGGVMMRANDGNWAAAVSGTTANLHAALMTDTLSYVAGDDGTLLALQNGSWKPIATGTHAALYGLDDL